MKGIYYKELHMKRIIHNTQLVCNKNTCRKTRQKHSVANDANSQQPSNRTI